MDTEHRIAQERLDEAVQRLVKAGLCPACLESTEDCLHCEGVGWWQDHDPRCDGENCLYCPVQVQCDKCKGEGVVPPKHDCSEVIVEDIDRCLILGSGAVKDDLPF